MLGTLSHHRDQPRKEEEGGVPNTNLERSQLGTHREQSRKEEGEVQSATNIEGPTGTNLEDGGRVHPTTNRKWS